MCSIVRVLLVPGNCINLITPGVFIVLPSAAGSKFPFGFGWEAIVLAGPLVQYRDELLYVVPTHILHRAVRATLLVVSRIFPHNLLPLSLCDFVPGNAEIIDTCLFQCAVTTLKAPALDSH